MPSGPPRTDAAELAREPSGVLHRPADTGAGTARPTRERSMKFAQLLYELSHLSSIYFHLLSFAFSRFDTHGNLPNVFSHSSGFRQDHAKHAAFESGFDMIDADTIRKRNRSLAHTERSCQRVDASSILCLFLSP